ncbi:MAG: hypothetical protein R2751_11810 [Bacteroidales bacterium]
MSEEAGIFASGVIGFGLETTVGDVNQDGWMDIYVSSLISSTGLPLPEPGRRHLPEAPHRASPLHLGGLMGADMADLDNDRYPEIFVTDMIPEHDAHLKTKTTFDSWDSYSTNVRNGYHHQFTGTCSSSTTPTAPSARSATLPGVYATDWSWEPSSWTWTTTG